MNRLTAWWYWRVEVPREQARNREFWASLEQKGQDVERMDHLSVMRVCEQRDTYAAESEARGDKLTRITQIIKDALQSPEMQHYTEAVLPPELEAIRQILIESE